MTAPPLVASDRMQVALWSLVSVLLLVVMCAIYVAHGDPQSVERGRPHSLRAAWYTVILAAPYAFIIVLSLLPDPPRFLLEFARALSRAAIIGILFVTVGSGVGFTLFLMMIQTAHGELWLPTVHTNCTDSLVTALRNQNVILEILPNKEGGFFAVATAGEYAPTKYMTDETGILLRDIDDVPLRTVTPSSIMPALLVDSIFLDLVSIRDCISRETVGERGQYPLHLPKAVRCHLHGDTSVVHLRDGTPYRLIYASARNSAGKPVRSFSLSMRPVVYGKPYVRSFLMTEDSAFVTTANRSARKSDPAPRGCEVRPDDCRRQR